MGGDGRRAEILAWTGLLARLVVGGVWIVAGAVKLPDPTASVNAVRAYELLPSDVAEIVGLALPVTEVVIGVALVLGVLTRGVAVVSALLFTAFVIGIASVWARGIEIDCGCFGGGGADPGAASEYPVEIARDAALLVASLFLVWLRRSRLALDAVLLGPARTSDDPADPTDPNDLDRPEPSVPESDHEKQGTS